MEVAECVVKRKSIRYFRKKEIEEKLLCEILNAGVAAPSPKNIQPWRFKVVRKGLEKNRVLKSLVFLRKLLKRSGIIKALFVKI